MSFTWASSRSLGLNLSLARVCFKTYERNKNFWLNSKLLKSQSVLKTTKSKYTCICYHVKTIFSISLPKFCMKIKFYSSQKYIFSTVYWTRWTCVVWKACIECSQYFYLLFIVISRIIKVKFKPAWREILGWYELQALSVHCESKFYTEKIQSLESKVISLMSKAKSKVF